MEFILRLLRAFTFPEQYLMPVAGMITMLLFIILLYLAWYFFRTVSHKYLYSKYFNLKNPKWYKAIKETNFLAAFGYLGAGIIANFALNFFFPESYQALHDTAQKIVTVYFQICILIILNKILSVVVIVNKDNPNIPIKGVIQFIKIFINFFGGLIILAFFIGKEPTYFISALGVIASVLLIVFRDTILGLTASWQLAMNDMLHIGDWIEMPKHGADGEVIDISLTTVSVQNWDKTIISIPAYDLISNSFQNWRGMTQAGGRRIKRAIYIDMQSIKFVDEEMLKKLKKFDLLKEYLAKKEGEIKEYNLTHNTTETLYNGRYLTNIGTFRAYCEAYIKSRPYINKNLISMVRQLSPGAQGLPLEMYCFTATTAWIPYEGYQSDLFDHLLSVMEEFDLYVFQDPTTWNFKSILAVGNKKKLNEVLE